MSPSPPRSPSLHRLFLLLWLLSILLVAVGELLPTGSPVMHFVGMLPVSDKVLHFSAYTWLAFLALLAVRRRPAALLAALSMPVLGLALEFGQKLVPGRTFQTGDILANTLGALVAIVLSLPISRRA